MENSNVNYKTSTENTYIWVLTQYRECVSTSAQNKLILLWQSPPTGSLCNQVWKSRKMFNSPILKSGKGIPKFPYSVMGYLQMIPTAVKGKTKLSRLMIILPLLIA